MAKLKPLVMNIADVIKMEISVSLVTNTTVKVDVKSNIDKEILMGYLSGSCYVKDRLLERFFTGKEIDMDLCYGVIERITRSKVNDESNVADLIQNESLDVRDKIDLGDYSGTKESIDKFYAVYAPLKVLKDKHSDEINKLYNLIDGRKWKI